MVLLASTAAACQRLIGRKRSLRIAPDTTNAAMNNERAAGIGLDEGAMRPWVERGPANGEVRRRRVRGRGGGGQEHSIEDLTNKYHKRD